MKHAQTCPRTDCNNPAVIDPQYGVIPCKSCQEKDEKQVAHARRSPQFYTISMRDRIISQQDHHEKDMLQPFIANKPNPEFVRAYPEYRDQYFSKEELKNL